MKHLNMPEAPSSIPNTQGFIKKEYKQNYHSGVSRNYSVALDTIQHHRLVYSVIHCYCDRQSVKPGIMWLTFCEISLLNLLCTDMEWWEIVLRVIVVGWRRAHQLLVALKGRCDNSYRVQTEHNCVI